MKKILFVTYMFPPIAGGGIQRSLKFIKYLPSNNITPIVFCPQDAIWKASNHKNLDLPYVKHTKIYRCGIQKLQRYYDLRFKKGLTNHPYFHFLGLKYIWFIDYFSSWYFECRNEALKIAEQEEVECIFTTSPPHSVHLFGRHLKTKLGIPWIMDLRDAMYDDPNRDCNKIRHRMQSNIERIYEKIFYRSADAILSVSQPILDSIATRHGTLDVKTKSHLITNGFDEHDYADVDSCYQEKNKLLITYTGAFLMKHTPEFFFKSLVSLVSANEIDTQDILIRFVGYFDEAVLAIMKNYATLLPLQIIGFQPYEKTVAYQASSDLLLLIVGVDAGQGGGQIFTGKFFEYIGAQKPIFALAPEGPLKTVIEKGRFGIVAPPKDVAAIAEKFKNLYDQWKADKTLHLNPDVVLRNRFTRAKLTQKLAQIIHRVTI